MAQFILYFIFTVTTTCSHVKHIIELGGIASHLTLIAISLLIVWTLSILMFKTW